MNRTLATTGRAGAESLIPVEVDPIRVAELARYFVDTRRVVPGLTLDHERHARSWWWPLPTASDRDILRSIVPGPSLADHRAAATMLAEHVDALMRERLHGVAILEAKRGGRRAVPECWLVSLTSPDAALPTTLDAAKVAAFADEVTTWVRSGTASTLRVRVVLRLDEPIADDADWHVRVLVQDSDEPSLMVDAPDLWASSSFPPSAIGELLLGLGRIVRIAPELGGLLDTARPGSLALSTDAVVALVRDRVAQLVDAGSASRCPVGGRRVSEFDCGRRPLGLGSRRRRRAPTRQGGAALVSTSSSRSPGRPPSGIGA